MRFSDPDGKMGEDCCGGDDPSTAFLIGGAVLNTVKDLAVSGVNVSLMMTGNPLRVQSGEKFADVSLDLSRFGPQTFGQQVRNIANNALDGLNVASTIGTGSVGGGVVLFAKTGGKAALTTAFTKVGKEAINETGKASSGLGNPFKGKTVQEVQQGFEKQVQAGKLKPAYTDPVSGSKSYVNPKSKYSYNVDTGLSGKTGTIVEPPHVNVNYPNPKPANRAPKRKFFFE